MVGDKLYAQGERYFLDFLVRGARPALLRALEAPRHLLHAVRLEFSHPRDGRRLVLEAALPDDMTRFVHSHDSHATCDQASPATVMLGSAP